MAERDPRASVMRWIHRMAHPGLQIFIFHRVLPHPDPLLPDEPDASEFDALCGWIARHFTVLPLDEAVRRLQQGRLPASAACITFDDGYLDNLTVAAPILRRHDLSATCFVATGFIGGGRMWNDSVIEAIRMAPEGSWDGTDFGLGIHTVSDAASRVRLYRAVLGRFKHLPHGERLTLSSAVADRAGLPASSDLMMDRSQLRLLEQAGMQIGAHTRTHPILAQLPDRQAEEEVAGSVEELTAWLGQRPVLFAYPNGVPYQDYAARDLAIVRRVGFEAAVSTAWGCVRPGDDLFQLRRFTPWDRQEWKFVARCVMNGWRRQAVVDAA